MESETYMNAFRAGKAAVNAKPHTAPRNPYNEETNPDAFNGWEEGAIEAGICEIYTNGNLDPQYR